MTDRVSDERLHLLLGLSNGMADEERAIAMDLQDCRAERDALKSDLYDSRMLLDNVKAERDRLSASEARLRALLVRARDLEENGHRAWSSDPDGPGCKDCGGNCGWRELLADIEKELSE